MQALSPALTPWRPLFWEPVAGTGERIMVGVLHRYGGRWSSARIIRDDVLDSLYGASSAAARRLIDYGLGLYQAAAATVDGAESLNVSLGGLHPGPLRETSASSAADLLRTAALLYSSLANLDKLDDADEADAPQNEEVNRRFSTEVRDTVALRRPDLLRYFGRPSTLIEGGQPVRFGFLSPKIVMHFVVLHPVRQNPSVRDARARIFELQRAREISGIVQAALIAAVPRPDDATLGSKQRDQLGINRKEIEDEVDAMHMQWYAVHTALEGADRVIEVASA
ncbi:hypothetical protein FB547_10919 [Variovorax beijingensis]|uniref:Uncharacterized protein n=2 Tax=Variovorax beijingensis TaxID=2496117 RepID=A0A561BF18_9BURK|nr:hypothetical protein FB547_10919 [Variovorax beijingensis]